MVWCGVVWCGVVWWGWGGVGWGGVVWGGVVWCVKGVVDEGVVRALWIETLSIYRRLYIGVGCTVINKHI